MQVINLGRNGRIRRTRLSHHTSTNTGTVVFSFFARPVMGTIFLVWSNFSYTYYIHNTFTKKSMKVQQCSLPLNKHMDIKIDHIASAHSCTYSGRGNYLNATIYKLGYVKRGSTMHLKSRRMAVASRAQRGRY